MAVSLLPGNRSPAVAARTAAATACLASGSTRRSPLWAQNFRVNVTTAADQFQPRVEVLTNGNLVVTWTDSAEDGSSNGVFARIIMPDGTPVTDEFRVNDQRISSQGEPDITALDSGGFVITWSDNNGTDGSGVGVFAQQYNANGNRLDSQFQVNTEFTSTQSQPVVTELPNGGFVIAWTSNTSGSAGDGSANGVFYQVFANAAPVVSPVSASGDEDTAIILDAAVFEAGFVDPDGQTLQAIQIDTLPSQGTLTLNGNPVAPGTQVSIAQLQNNELVYQGNQDFNGVDQFLWTGSDGISFAGALVAADITVNPVNDAPGLEAGADTTVGEGQQLLRNLTLTDPDADNRSFTIDFGDGTAATMFNSAALTPLISHVFGAEGVFTVTVTVDDNAGDPNSVEMDSFDVTVTNSPPNASNDFQQVSEDAAGTPLDVLANDSDPGGDPFNMTLVEGGAFVANTPIVLGSGATVTVDNNGDFIYDPNGAFETLGTFQFGNDSFTYTIEDDGGLTDTATVNIQIDGQNDAPVAQDDALSANDDTPIVENVLVDNANGADSDEDAPDVLTVTEINGSAGDVGNQIILPSGATVTLQSDGTLDYDPTTLVGTPTSDSFTYVVSDGNGASDQATVTITINSSNTPPVAQDDNVSTDEDTALIGGDVFADNGNGIDDDADGDMIRVVSVEGIGGNVGNQITLASGALLTLNMDGTFDYDPNDQFEMTALGSTDTDSFLYRIADGNGGSDPAMVTITINGVNDDPVALNVFDTADEDGGTTSGNVFTRTSDIDTGTVFMVDQVGGSALAVGVLQTRPSGATFLIEANGDYTFDPAGGHQSLSEGQTVNDVIGFTVIDGDGGSDTAGIIVTVTGVNDAPVAEDDDFTVAESQVLNDTVFGDNGNGADSDVDALDTFTVTSVNGSAPDIGTQITLGSGALLTLNASGHVLL